MIIVYPNLERELLESNISISILAEQLCLTEEDIHNRLCGITPWKLVEAMIICDLLNNSDVKYLFLQLDNKP